MIQIPSINHFADNLWIYHDFHHSIIEWRIKEMKYFVGIYWAIWNDDSSTCKMNGLKVLLCLLVCVLLTTAFEADVGSETYNVGSRTAKRGQFPYIVSLRTLKNRQHFCNGFILSEHWVGTAAQCISRETNIPSNVFVLAGAHTLTDGKWYNVSRIAVHPRYNARFLAFNVALVRTISKIKFHNRVQPVRFPKGPRIPENSPALIAGWGSNAVSAKIIGINSEFIISHITKWFLFFIGHRRIEGIEARVFHQFCNGYQREQSHAKIA